MPLKDLIIEDIVAGTGPAVKAGDPVSVHYTGRLEDGTVFDSSEGRDPLDFTCGIGLVIPGWDQGLIGLSGRGPPCRVPPPTPHGPVIGPFRTCRSASGGFQT